MAPAVLLLPPRLVSLPPHLKTRNTPARLHSLPPLGRRGARLRAVGNQTTVYNGVYGPWTVEDSDVREVLLYRSGLVTAAASFVAAPSAAFLPEGNAAGDAIRQSIDLLYVAGAAGLGLSLVLIHIYVTPIKRFLQVLWGVGVLGSVGTYLAAALRAGPSGGAVVRWSDVCCAHWSRLQGRSLLWKTGSWSPNFCYPWASSWAPVWLNR